MQALSREFRADGKTIGFVPTMGALHVGHLSLAQRSGEDNDITVVSIFVNPTQFGPNEDFDAYPRDTGRDLEELSSLNVDAVFMPGINDVYPEGTSVSVNVGSIGQILCGVSRSGHFSGVATVVAKLFNIVMPDRAYFGQKDFQQTVVIKKMVRELNFHTDVIVCPVVREKDGLAMSSRNSYLSDEERESAVILYKSLLLAEKLILSGGIKNAAAVKQEMEKLIMAEPLVNIDYIDIVDIDNLETMQEVELPAAICIAVKIGNTRLIDNIIVKS
jgi:pantoate--beta-alanine ligase